MNLNVQQIQGEVLVVSQFTLMRRYAKGLRPSFPKVLAYVLPMNYIPILFKSAMKNPRFLRRICCRYAGQFNQ